MRFSLWSGDRVGCELGDYFILDFRQFDVIGDAFFVGLADVAFRRDHWTAFAQSRGTAGDLAFRNATSRTVSLLKLSSSLFENRVGGAPPSSRGT